MPDVAENVRKLADEYIDDETRARLVESFSHRNDDGDLVIATDGSTIMKIVAGIVAAIFTYRVAKWIVPKLWKLKWVVLACGIAVVVYMAFYEDKQ
jgi:hypothetical protein